MTLDAVILSRAQFALTIMFHYLFPPLSIGLGGILVIMEGLALRTGEEIYETMARFWTKIFAVNFALGVASGIVMEFQFGTNWAAYSRFVGDVFGSALAAEGIFAFFLESGFLGLLVFGWDRVSRRTHFVATVMVALGALLSAVWIIVANSWQQTPAGHHLVTLDGRVRAEIVDFWAVVFNPSSIHRLTHTVLGAYALSGFVVCGVAAYYLLKGRHLEFARRSMVIGLAVAGLASAGLPLSGHFQARTVAKTQPIKLAAFEGLYQTRAGAPMSIIGWPDDSQRRVRWGLEVPGLLSRLVHDGRDGIVQGLDSAPPEDWPPVRETYFFYHGMLAVAGAMAGLLALSAWLLWRGKLFETRPVLWAHVFAVVLPYAGNELGWCAAEVGRQPWIVQGLLRTRDAASPSVPAGHILVSIVAFAALYAVLFALWVCVTGEKIRRGPEEPGGEVQPA